MWLVFVVGWNVFGVGYWCFKGGVVFGVLFIFG